MKYLKIDKPTGFIGNDSVKIYEKNGQLFYSFAKEGKIKFNLPKGEYYTNSDIVQCSKMHSYDFKRTRKRENFHYEEIDRVKVVIAPNPNKASIFLKKHIVVIDPSFLKMGRAVIDYLISHEIGHYHYKSEEFCDEFAQERLLKQGYNKSQIANVSAKTLGLHNGRVHTCVQNLKNAKIK